MIDLLADLLVDTDRQGTTVDSGLSVARLSSERIGDIDVSGDG